MPARVDRAAFGVGETKRQRAKLPVAHGHAVVREAVLVDHGAVQRRGSDYDASDNVARAVA